jgi:outer membrane immunogenic protein
MNKFIFTAAIAAAISTPVMAEDGAKSGARIEGRLMYETPTVSSVETNNDVYKIGSAVAYGAEAGYDFKVGEKVVVGPYVNFEKSSVKACVDGDCLKVKDNFAAGLHLGYALSEKGQIYVKAGYAKLRINVTGSAVVGNPPQLVNVNETNGGAGVQGAIGYEHGFGKNFYGRVELGYADNGRILGLNTQRRHAGISLGARF